MLGYQTVAREWRNDEHREEQKEWGRRYGKAEINGTRNGGVRYETIEWKYNREMKGR
jgi:hypothetical protein